jgi:hypothetical protein
MDNLFIYLIILVILAIVVVLIYLVDKVNAIEGRGTVGELASQAAALITSGPSLDNGFNGLSGKKLWDTACGKAEPPLGTPELESFRKRYEPILNKHILGLIEDGGHDAAGGTSRSPQATRSISTLRANVESWLPPQHVSALYKAGYEAASNPADLPRIAQGLDETCTTLYARCGIDIGQPYSQRVFNDASSNNGGDKGDSAATLLEGPRADPAQNGAADAGAQAGDFEVDPVNR